MIKNSDSVETIYFSHGFRGWALAHPHTIQDLRKSNRSVVVSNMLGHGSVTGELTHIVQHYKELVDQEVSVFRYYDARCGKGKPFSFVGFSTGAVVSLLAAFELCKDETLKKRLNRIVLLGPAFDVNHNAPWYLKPLIPAEEWVLENIAQPCPEQALLQLLTYGCVTRKKHIAKMKFKATFVPEETSGDLIIQDYLVTNPRVYKKGLCYGWAFSIAVGGQKAFSLLEKMSDIPILILHGEKDRVAKIPVLDPKKHSHVTLEVVEDKPHDVFSGPPYDVVPRQLLAEILVKKSHAAIETYDELSKDEIAQLLGYKPSDDYKRRERIIQFLDEGFKK